MRTRSSLVLSMAVLRGLLHLRSAWVSELKLFKVVVSGAEMSRCETWWVERGWIESKRELASLFYMSTRFNLPCGWCCGNRFWIRQIRSEWQLKPHGPECSTGSEPGPLRPAITVTRCQCQFSREPELTSCSVSLPTIPEREVSKFERWKSSDSPLSLIHPFVWLRIVVLHWLEPSRCFVLRSNSKRMVFELSSCQIVNSQSVNRSCM